MSDKVYTLDEIRAIALEDGFQKDLDLLTTQMLTPQFLNDIRPEEVLIYAQN